MSAIKRAGERIRRAVEDGTEPADDDLTLLDLYRSSHYSGLREIDERLRRFHHKELGVDPAVITIVARPLKTREAIIAKLVRDKTRLNRIRDIAGARVVVSTPRTQDLAMQATVLRFKGLQARVAKDSRQEPDPTGYRAVHIEVMTFQKGVGERFGEIQIRTEVQESWAQVVESIDSAYGWDLKHGRAPAEADEWRAWLLATSQCGAAAERGEKVTLPPAPKSVLP
jgi:ppGpp synthetase/RelA/SpoT-type nucleotidyltranferase